MKDNMPQQFSLNTTKVFILVLSLLFFNNSISGKLKGDIDNYLYYPPMGTAQCKSHDITFSDTKSKYFSEKFSQNGGIVDFWNGGFSYRLDLHVSNLKQNNSEFNYKKYFHSDALTHFLKDFPKGQLVDESVQNIDNKRVYFAALFYPKRRGGLKNSFEMIKPHYRIMMIYKGTDYIYTLSKGWPGVYGRQLQGDYEANKNNIKQAARGLFSKCRFDVKREIKIPIKQTYPSTITIEVIDKHKYKKVFFRYVNWDGENYSPGAFLASIKNSTVKRINLMNTNDEEKKSCVAYLGKKAKIKVYELNDVGEYVFIKNKPRKKFCVYSRKAKS